MKLKNLLNIQRQLNKPEYYFRPEQLFKRIQYKNENRKSVAVQIDSSGKNFFVNENEVIGQSILTMGVYDLVVAETISRLIDPGDLFVDVGANIGYFTRQAIACGALTYSFEPHPKLFERLQTNLKNMDQAHLENLALSSREGQFDLYIPIDFAKNEGVASLEPMENSEKISVQTKQLDSFNLEQIKLMKIDVEGHELDVLQGAQNLLQNKNVDFVVYEDFAGSKSKVVVFLKEFGYHSYRLNKTLFGPKLVELRLGDSLPKWEPPNFIAAKDTNQLKEKFKKRHWNFLKLF